MTRRSCSVLLISILGLFLATASAQMIGVKMSTGPNKQLSLEATFRPPTGALQAATGAPYSAEQVTEHVQTLADGTHITQPPESIRMFRDAEGRTRTERPFISRSNDPSWLPICIEITDPVANYQYILDTANRVAHRSLIVAMPVFERAPLAQRVAVLGRSYAISAAQGTSRTQTTIESAGNRVIEGVETEGTVTKYTYPTGAFGNDRPVVMTSEEWYARSLKMVVMTRTFDPRSGDRTVKLVKINRSPPDPTLFQVPADYTIVDEVSPFTIKIERPQPSR